ncbi:MAG: YaaR family protein [Spirochaetes bacterium]|nr:YaaR family protein [Spirochaetota bacterium]
MNKIDPNYPLFHPDLVKKKKDVRKGSEQSGKATKAKLFQDLLTEETNTSEQQAIEQLEISNDVEVQLDHLLTEIGKQGKLLKRNLNLQNLNKYKMLIQQFLKKIMESATQLENKVLWNKFKKEKIAKVHYLILNKELLELTQYFMQTQLNVLAIAAKIDRIEGLLIDLKT